MQTDTHPYTHTHHRNINPGERGIKEEEREQCVPRSAPRWMRERFLGAEQYVVRKDPGGLAGRPAAVLIIGAEAGEPSTTPPEPLNRSGWGVHKVDFPSKKKKVFLLQKFTTVLLLDNRQSTFFRYSGRF